MKRTFSLLSLFLFISFTMAQTQLGSDIDGEAAGDYSGCSVSISSDGSKVAIGANQNDGNGSMAGHVRIYEYSGESWIQLGNDIDGEAYGDYSGGSVSMNANGSRVAIGAGGNDSGGQGAGHVRIYEYSDGSWTQLGNEMYSYTSFDSFGSAVSMNSDGSRVAIGAAGSSTGYVQVYEYSDGTWSILGANIDAGIGWLGMVSMNSDGSRVSISAPGGDGRVRIYEYSNGSWNQLGSDIDSEDSGDQFGSSVAMNSDGNKVAIGGRYNDGGGSNAGHIRVFEYISGEWSQLGGDIDSDTANDQFGSSVAMSSDGNKIVIGANGNGAGFARLFEYNDGVWGQIGDDIYGEASGDQFGYKVSMSSDGNIFAIGAYKNDGNGADEAINGCR